MIAGHPGSFAVRALVLRPDNQKTEEMRMKKILVIQGGGGAKGNNAQLVSSFVAGAEESGHSAEVILLLKNEVKGCLGCNACRYGKPCIQKDAFNDLVLKIKDADCIVFASPLYFWTVSYLSSIGETAKSGFRER